jgi:hypothetical protein
MASTYTGAVKPPGAKTCPLMDPFPTVPPPPHPAGNVNAKAAIMIHAAIRANILILIVMSDPLR